MTVFCRKLTFCKSSPKSFHHHVLSQIALNAVQGGALPFAVRARRGAPRADGCGVLQVIDLPVGRARNFFMPAGPGQLSFIGSVGVEGGQNNADFIFGSHDDHSEFGVNGNGWWGPGNGEDVGELYVSRPRTSWRVARGPHALACLAMARCPARTQHRSRTPASLSVILTHYPIRAEPMSATPPDFPRRRGGGLGAGARQHVGTKRHSEATPRTGAHSANTLSFLCISPPRTTSPPYEHAPSCTQRRAFCAMASFIAAAMYLTLPGLTPAIEKRPLRVQYTWCCAQTRAAGSAALPRPDRPHPQVFPTGRSEDVTD
jgi:hypothetical protein